MSRGVGRSLVWFLAVLLAPVAAPATGTDGPAAARQAVDQVLTALHQAASEADGERYFDLFAESGVFMGTDPGERWTVAEFRQYALGRFERGDGWTYTMVERHIEVSEGGALAWFDELLENANYGTCRGTGVLLRTDDGWKIVQYNLALLVPNEVTPTVVRVIRGEE